MADIKVTFTDGTDEYFKDEGAPGGSYSNTITYEDGFVCITDPYGKQTMFPSSTIKRIDHYQHRGF